MSVYSDNVTGVHFDLNTVVIIKNVVIRAIIWRGHLQQNGQEALWGLWVPSQCYRYISRNIITIGATKNMTNWMSSIIQLYLSSVAFIITQSHLLFSK